MFKIYTKDLTRKELFCANLNFTTSHRAQHKKVRFSRKGNTLEGASLPLISRYPLTTVMFYQLQSVFLCSYQVKGRIF
jgi:hypothetical protein